VTNFPKWVKRIEPFIEILKLKSSVLDVSTVLVTSAFLGNIDGRILLALFSGILIHSGGDVINDIYDREIDKICKPKAPIPSGRMSVKAAWLYLLLLVSIALPISLLLSKILFICLVLGILEGYILYSHPWFRLKDVPVASIALIALYFSLESIGLWSIYSPITRDTGIIAGYVFFLVFSLAFMKDFRDVRGDINSLPILIGIRKAAIISSMLAIFPAFILIALSVFYGSFKILIAAVMFLFLISFCIRILLFDDPVAKGSELKDKMILSLGLPNMGLFISNFV
jgi:geranylgeranylglycerol-phosphate geranylgeranyltransferase